MSFGQFLYRNRLITISLILWAVLLVSWVTYRVFGVAPPELTTATVTAYTAVLGLPSVVFGLWKWRNSGD